MTSSPSRPGLAVAVVGALGLAYPVAVYLSLGRVPAGAMVLVALGLIAGRLLVLRRTAAARALMPALIGIFAVTGSLGLLRPATAVLAYPVMMSLGMATAFGLSLRRDPCLVECFAMMTEPAPSPAARAYMRRVSLIWCLFLLGNAGLSLMTAALGDMGVWALYNGLIAYVLMGTLFAVEYAVRRRVRTREALR
ncbi:hypothetical protein [Magnetospirillum sp. 15-1]|uniref:COG4648 family protein n=1 Tax=Magnetospirillum sp. 15-1 TaxID=1979370 RepID=UPI0014838C3E|nr:hypothetical protein [Magnetospirillum sp. 15-1]